MSAPEPPRGSVAEYLASLLASPRFGSQVVHHHRQPARPARFGELREPLAPPLAAALAGCGVRRLYSHQAEAIDLLATGRDLMVATPTASGKSLVYNLPVFQTLLADPQARALYLFPLKALAQDQLRAIEALAGGLPEPLRPSAAICDGDTSAYRRRKLREQPPRILISNPDMLHLSLLGYHRNWSGFWQGVRYVILDEAHTYRGVFGSHLAWVLKRLRRICRLHGAAPRFLLSSATIGNPGELAAQLLGREVATITDSGGPRGERHFLFLDPVAGPPATASQLLEAAIRRGLRAIVFSQSRKLAELVSVWTQGRLGKLASRLASYRAGYLPEERRRLEADLSQGRLLGVVATSALELGIDIGGLDICILVGYPGTIMQTLQRSGRAGRGRGESLTVLVGGEDALDQYFLRNPDDFFARPVEEAVLDPFNPVIMEKHLLCGAAEQPLDREEELCREPRCREAIDRLTGEGRLLLDAAGRSWHSRRRFPHRRVDLRGGGQRYAIHEAASERLLGEVDENRCFRECHPGAVYLHQGRTWLVERLSIEERRVVARQRRTAYFTRPLAEKQTEILAVTGSRQFAHFEAFLGRLRVTDTITGFQKRLVRGQKLISSEPLDLPPLIFETEGLWFTVPSWLEQHLVREQRHFMGGIHAVEHAAIGVFPLLVLCDRNDVGGIAYPQHPQLGGAAVFIYDGQPGGVGLCRQAFGRLEELLALGRRIIRSCPCETGCPSCVHSPKCGSGNRPIDKGAALGVLAGLLVGRGREVGLAGVRERSEPPVAAAAVVSREATGPEPCPPPGRYGVFDLETKRSAAEVGGWHRAERMGVSVAVLYDSALDDFLVFTEPELEQLITHLQRLDLVVGFNNLRFDNQVLSAYTGINLGSLPTLDMLQVVQARLGYRLSLDHLAEHTLGVRKSANGLLALKWFKEGKIDRIIDYCRQDVKITRDLYRFGREHGYLLFRNKAGDTVRCPVRFDRPGGSGVNRWRRRKGSAGNRPERP